MGAIGGCRDDVHPVGLQLNEGDRGAGPSRPSRSADAWTKMQPSARPRQPALEQRAHHRGPAGAGRTTVATNRSAALLSTWICNASLDLKCAKSRSSTGRDRSRGGRSSGLPVRHAGRDRRRGRGDGSRVACLCSRGCGPATNVRAKRQAVHSWRLLVQQPARIAEIGLVEALREGAMASLELCELGARVSTEAERARLNNAGAPTNGPLAGGLRRSRRRTPMPADARSPASARRIVPASKTSGR